VLSDHELTGLIKRHDGEQLLEELIAAVKVKGAPDNVTVLWGTMVEDESESGSQITLIGAAGEQ